MRCVICDELLLSLRDDPQNPGKLAPCAVCLDKVTEIEYDNNTDEETNEPFEVMGLDDLLPSDIGDTLLVDDEYEHSD